MLKFAKGILEQSQLNEAKYQQLNNSTDAADAIQKDLVSAFINPQLTPSFRKKRYRKFLFRSQKCPNEPGIVIFMSKPPSHDSLEQLMLAIFRKQYPDIISPTFLYFDENNKVVPFSKLKKNSYTFVYITESYVDAKSKKIDSEIDSYIQKQPQPMESLPKNNQPDPIKEQFDNLDLYVLRETLYNDYLSGRYSLDDIEDSYAGLQFFLEKCSEEVWNYLDDFADVSYKRRKHLAGIVETIDGKRQDVLEVKEVLEEVLADFEEQERIVREIFTSIGFSDAFVETTNPMTSNQSSSRQSTINFPQTRMSSYMPVETTQSFYQDNQMNTFRTEQEDYDSVEFDYLPKSGKEV